MAEEKRKKTGGRRRKGELILFSYATKISRPAKKRDRKKVEIVSAERRRVNSENGFTWLFEGRKGGEKKPRNLFKLPLGKENHENTGVRGYLHPFSFSLSGSSGIGSNSKKDEGEE